MVCKFFPTPGRSAITSIPLVFNSSAGPMPDNKRILGEFSAEAAIMTSFDA